MEKSQFPTLLYSQFLKFMQIGGWKGSFFVPEMFEFYIQSMI